MRKNERLASIINDTASYYDAKIIEHGDTAKGVDWNSIESQTTRFHQLAKIIRNGSQENFSLADLGCGYGALYDFLKVNYNDFSYLGFDISEIMVKHAEERYLGVENAHFFTSSQVTEKVDYIVASGIFNVRHNYSDSHWFEYIVSILDHMHEKSNLGFSFNCLTSYSDPPKMREYLYYSDPCAIFDLCKKRYSRNVALLHDYDLYEFTVLVRKVL